LSRDSIEEQGGENLYGFVSNNPLSWWDWLGNEGDDKKGDDNTIPKPTPGAYGPMYFKPPKWHTNKPDEGKPCCEKAAVYDTITVTPKLIGKYQFKITTKITWTKNSGKAKDLTWAWFTCWRTEKGKKTEAGYFPPNNPNGKKNVNPLDMTLPSPENTLVNVNYAWLSCEGWSGDPKVADGIWTLKKVRAAGAILCNDTGSKWIKPPKPWSRKNEK
jgi:hypothetical protein